MDFKKGYTIKPKEVLTNGEVIFTDGTNDVRSNQITCEAYGYNWGTKSQKCFAYRHNSKVHTSFRNTTNQRQGSQNKTERDTISTIINGNDNITKGTNKNNLINGENNTLNSGVNNAVIFGKNANVLNSGQFTIGGGAGSSDFPLGNKQTSIIQLGGVTTDNTATNLAIFGNTGADVNDRWIEYQNNSVFAFEVKVIGLCYGGSSGTAGHYVYQEIKGAAVITDGFTPTFSQSTTTIASSGTTGSAVMAHAGVDPYITVKVTGTTNVSIEWFASVQLTENKLNSVTF